MISGISGTALGTGSNFQTPPPRPDFSALDADKSGGMSLGELKTGLSNGSFGAAPSQGGDTGQRPPPPPGGGQGGPDGAEGRPPPPPPSSSEGGVAARMLEGALELLASDDTEASDSAIETLFAAMDGDGDGAVTDSEFRDFGAQVGGRDDGGEAARATASASALYGDYQSMDAVTMLASQITGLRM